MTFLNVDSYSFSRPSLSNKINDLEVKVEQISEKFKELLLEVQLIDNESRNYQDQFLKQKEKCESKTCTGSEALKGEIASKNNIIQMAASFSITLKETKNLSLITEILKILCGEFTTLTPPKDSLENKENDSKSETNTTPKKKTKLSQEVKKKLLSPKKELDCSAEEISFKEESTSEIEGTPGRTSPIIGSRKLKNSSSMSNVSGSSTDSKNKTKCPNNWHSSESKQVKLMYSSKNGMRGIGRQRQGRLTTFLTKKNSLVDLTCSPEPSSSGISSDSGGKDGQIPHIKFLIKQESSENEDTILPSPTSSGSGASNILSKTSKDSQKFKKSPLSLKKEVMDNEEVYSPIISVVDKKLKDNSKIDFEESINILQPKRFKSPFKNQDKGAINSKQLSPTRTNNNYEISIKTEQPSVKDNLIPVKESVIPVKVEVLDDVTHCEDASMSILQKAKKLDEELPMDVDIQSPTKRPLGENKNLCNVSKGPFENNMSIAEPAPNTAIDKTKRRYMQNVEPVYKEPTVRKKAEKMALPGWCCDECVNFFGDLYEDDPDKIAKIVARCSKHRGRNNPVRPKTPPGFWYPRWDVPQDTEEFNRRNNV